MKVTENKIFWITRKNKWYKADFCNNCSRCKNMYELLKYLEELKNESAKAIDEFLLSGGNDTYHMQREVERLEVYKSILIKIKEIQLKTDSV